MRLRVWTVADDRRYRDEDLQALASLRHVRNLKISQDKQASLAPLAQMTQLEVLVLGGKKSLSLEFLPSLAHLRELELHGSFSNMELLAGCRSLRGLYAGGRNMEVDALAAALPDSVPSLILDCCAAPADLAVLSRPGLEDLHLASLVNFDNADALAAFTGLRSLQLSGAPKLTQLPDLSGMRALRQMALKGMKTWNNPEVLQTASNLETLTLAEINTALKAERFAFLPSLPALRRIDFRFIDFGQRRRTRIGAMFAAAGKSALAEPYDDDG